MPLSLPRVVSLESQGRKARREWALHGHGGEGYLDINGRLELLDVLVQGLGLPPASLC